MTKEIQARDHYDSTRKVSPLKQAEDAVRIDTTGKSIPEVVQAIKEVIQRKRISLVKIRKKAKIPLFLGKTNEIALFFFK